MPVIFSHEIDIETMQARFSQISPDGRLTTGTLQLARDQPGLGRAEQQAGRQLRHTPALQHRGVTEHDDAPALSLRLDGDVAEIFAPAVEAALGKS